MNPGSTLEGDAGKGTWSSRTLHLSALLSWDVLEIRSRVWAGCSSALHVQHPGSISGMRGEERAGDGKEAESDSGRAWRSSPSRLSAEMGQAALATVGENHGKADTASGLWTPAAGGRTPPSPQACAPASLDSSCLPGQLPSQPGLPSLHAGPKGE